MQVESVAQTLSNCAMRDGSSPTIDVLPPQPEDTSGESAQRSRKRRRIPRGDSASGQGRLIPVADQFPEDLATKRIASLPVIIRRSRTIPKRSQDQLPEHACL